MILMFPFLRFHIQCTPQPCKAYSAQFSPSLMGGATAPKRCDSHTHLHTQGGLLAKITCWVWGGARSDKKIKKKKKKVGVALIWHSSTCEIWFSSNQTLRFYIHTKPTVSWMSKESLSSTLLQPSGRVSNKCTSSKLETMVPFWPPKFLTFHI